MTAPPAAAAVARQVISQAAPAARTVAPLSSVAGRTRAAVGVHAASGRATGSAARATSLPDVLSGRGLP